MPIASVDAAASATWRTSVDPTPELGTTEPEAAFAASDSCQSVSRVAKEKFVFTYGVPSQCALMMVCAGSPRAGSTAHCMIAENVLKKVMSVLAQDGSSKHEKPEYSGYWNYHLHGLCAEGVEQCGKGSDSRLFQGLTGSLDEFEERIDGIPGLSDEGKETLTKSMNDVRRSVEALNAVDAESVVVVKTHEFDSALMSACSRRLILTSFREKEEVFDSGLELGWFSHPKESSRAEFNKVYDLWSGWRRCWTEAAAADPSSTQVHDLAFDSLNREETFRDEITRLVRVITRVLRDDAAIIDAAWIVDEALRENFRKELNPSMTNGNLPLEHARGEASEKDAAATEKDASPENENSSSSEVSSSEDSASSGIVDLPVVADDDLGEQLSTDAEEEATTSGEDVRAEVSSRDAAE